MNKCKFNIHPRTSSDTAKDAGPYTGMFTLNSGTAAPTFGLTDSSGHPVDPVNGAYDFTENQTITFSVCLGPNFTPTNMPTITSATLNSTEVSGHKDAQETPFGNVNPINFTIVPGSGSTLPTANTEELQFSSSNGTWKVTGNFSVTTPQTFTWDPEVIVGTGTNSNWGHAHPPQKSPQGLTGGL